MTKIGIIGVGQMGTAIIKGLKKNPENTIIAENPVNPRVSQLAKELDFKLVNEISELAKENLDFVFLTTPADITLQIAHQLRDLNQNTTIISAAAGVSYANLYNQLSNYDVCRIIPNIPVAINAGTIGLYTPSELSQEEDNKIIDFLSQLGDVIQVKESQLSIVGTIGGCGPAFVDVFLDALGDAGVLNGLPRQLTNELAASMVKGAASLAYDTKQVPSILRDQVCSPGGTTIKGIASLEKNGFRNAIIEAINASNKN